MRSIRLGAGLSALFLLAGTVSAQQVTVATPTHVVGDSFFEHVGVNWGLNIGGFNVSFGRPNMAAPQFGNFDPSAGINGGFGFNGGGLNGFLNFGLAQGYRQSLVSQTPSVTLMNGQSAFISDATVSPFVVGFIPVVGDYAMTPHGYQAIEYPGYTGLAATQGNPRVQAMLRQLCERSQGGEAAAATLPGGPALRPPVRKVSAPGGLSGKRANGVLPASRTPRGAEKLSAARSSSAGRAVPSVAEARRLRQLEQAADNQQALVLFERGMKAEEDGKPKIASKYYKIASRRANGELKGRIQARVESLVSSGDR